MPAAVADTSQKSVIFAGDVYTMEPLGEGSYTVLRAGKTVGRIVSSYGVANAVPEDDTVSEEDLNIIGDAWFDALDT
jgi:hypothetical protein